MSVEIKVPVLGESVVEATVAKWMKASGEAVKADEAIVELETDKVTLEVPSPVNGVLSDIVATEGATVGVDALLGDCPRRRWSCEPCASSCTGFVSTPTRWKVVSQIAE